MLLSHQRAKNMFDAKYSKLPPQFGDVDYDETHVGVFPPPFGCCVFL